MAFPQKWLENPPGLEPATASQKNQLSQFAGYVRNLAIEGTAPQVLLAWLYQYEQVYTPPEKRIMQEQKAPDSEPMFEPQQAATINQGAIEIMREVKGVLAEISNALKNLSSMAINVLEKVDLAYAGSLDKLTDGMDKLTTGQEKLTGGYAQLTEDHRSFLGLIFPHVSDMYRTTNESIAAYRQGLIAQTQAEVKAATAAATGSEQAGLDAEISKALGGLITDAARAKMGLAPQSSAAQEGVKEVSQAAPKTE